MPNARPHDSVIQKTQWKICTSLTVPSSMKLSRLSRWSWETDRRQPPVPTAKIPIMAARHRPIRLAHRRTKSQNLLQSIRSRDVTVVALRIATLIVIIGSEASHVTDRNVASEKADLRRPNVGRIGHIVAGTLTNGPRTMMTMTMTMRTTAKALYQNGLHRRSIMKNHVAIKSILEETVITAVAANAPDHVHFLKIKNTPITGISPSSKQIYLVSTWFTPHNNYVTTNPFWLQVVHQFSTIK